MTWDWLNLKFINISQQKLIEVLEKNTSLSHSDFAGNLGEMVGGFLFWNTKKKHVRKSSVTEIYV